MNFNLYKITTKTNTHVGSGQNNYGIVDNVVQKDLLNQYPCMHSTSLKGALREYFEVNHKSNVEDIFGKEDANENKQGSHYFFQANLLSFPMRSDKVQYFNVTCPAIIENLKDQVVLFDTTLFENTITELEILIALQPSVNNPIALIPNAIIEEHTIKSVQPGNLSFSDFAKKLIGNNIAIMHNDDFNRLIKKLPIITRNHLENGQSKNLFYEEVVPRETRFWCLIGGENINEKFDEINLVQIGANATVGYGFCEFSKIS